MSRQWSGSVEKRTIIHDPPNRNLEHMLHELVDAVSDGAEFPNSIPPENSEEILLDVFLDGLRYVLIRMRPHAALDATLSPRETEIARMVAEGYANKTIAEVLEISCWTVGTHLRRIFAKLGVRTRAAMVAKLLDEGSMKEKDDRRQGMGSRRQVAGSK